MFVNMTLSRGIAIKHTNTQTQISLWGLHLDVKILTLYKVIYVAQRKAHIINKTVQPKSVNLGFIKGWGLYFVSEIKAILWKLVSAWNKINKVNATFYITILTFSCNFRFMTFYINTFLRVMRSLYWNT